MNITELLYQCDRKFCIAGEWGALVRWVKANNNPNPYRGKPVKWNLITRGERVRAFAKKAYDKMGEK